MRRPVVKLATTRVSIANWGHVFVQLNAWDALVTMWAVRNGYGEVVEANPLSRLVLSSSPFGFFVLKVTLAALIAWFCWRRHTRVILFGVVATSLVLLWNLFVVSKMFSV